MTCNTTVNRRRLPKAAAHRAPPGSGSSSSFALSVFQPVRDSQKPVASDRAGSVVMAGSACRASNSDGNAVCHSDLEILPAYPEASGANFEVERVQRPRRRAAHMRAIGVEYATVARTHE